MREGDYSPESGFAAVTSLLEERADFTALFVSNDTVALGRWRRFARRGYGFRRTSR